LLIDVQHNLDVAHGDSDIILVPPPTTCPGDPLDWGKVGRNFGICF
jgi:hypothetical protein